MVNKMHIVKQVYELTCEDIVSHKIWEYLSEDDPSAQDECTVRVPASSDVDSLEAMFISHAVFTTRSGAKYDGYVHPQVHGHANDLGLTQPCMFVDSIRALTFWYGCVEPDRSSISKDLLELGLNERDLFPIVWECAWRSKRMEGRGQVPGFAYISGATVKYLK